MNRIPEWASSMWRDDAASKGLGIALVEVGEDSATTRLAVEPRHVNGLGVCHGGIVATLADTAFAFACNREGESSVASGFEVDLVAPARLGAVLLARAERRHRVRSSGVYDVTVTTAEGALVALFRGRCVVVRRS